MKPWRTTALFSLTLLWALASAGDAWGQQSPMTCDAEPTDMMIADGDQIECSMGFGDSDFFRLEGSAGELVVLQAGSPGTLCMDLIGPSPDFAPIATRCGARLEAQLQDPGEHTVVVTDEGNNETYEYSIRMEKVAPESERCGALAGGVIGAAGETDVFVFEGKAGEHIGLSLVQTSGFGSGGFAVRARVFLGAVQLEGGSFQANQQRRFVLPAGGTYAVLLQAGDLTRTGTYVLGLECLTPPAAVNEALSCGGLLRDRTIDAAGEADLVTFEGMVGDHVGVTLSQTAGFGSGGFASRASVFAPSGGDPIQVFQANQQRRFFLPESGRYVIQINAGDLARSGTYNLGLECLGPVSAMDGTLACSSLLRDQTIDAAAEADLVTFEGDEGDHVGLTLAQTAGFGSGGFASRVRVFAPSESDPIQAFQANHQQRFVLPEEGRYVVQVTAGDESRAGTYNLGLECFRPAPVIDGGLPCGAVEEDLTIDAAADADLRAFTGGAGESVELTLVQTAGFGSGGFAVQARVFSPSLAAARGQFLTQVLTFQANRTVSLILPETGTYIVQTTAGDLIRSGTYNLGVSKLPFCDLGGSCGDRQVQASESCDLGSRNGASTSCCTLDCAIKPANAVCRPSSDSCDFPETCTGVTAECPVDQFAPNGRACSDGDLCTAGDQCVQGVCTGQACLLSDVCPTGRISIDFEEFDQPCLFRDTAPLTDQLLDAGVSFSGTGSELDQCANLFVEGYSPTNFVGYTDFEPGARTEDTLELACPADEVSFFAASDDISTFSVTALDASGAIVDSDTIKLDRGGTVVSLQGSGITRIEYDNDDGAGPAPDFVIDDIDLRVAPEPGHRLLGLMAAAALATLASRARRRR